MPAVAVHRQEGKALVKFTDAAMRQELVAAFLPAVGVRAGQGINNLGSFSFGEIVESDLSLQNVPHLVLKLDRRKPLPLADRQQVLNLLVGRRLVASFFLMWPP
jgi:hypothetical protein